MTAHPTPEAAPASPITFINVSHWDTREAWDAATADPAFENQAATARDDRTTPVTSSTGLYDVVVEFSAAAV
ncbi:hypothetical protein [Nocardia sp. NPDC056100]|uniref:hypothetical protein n=1 Tax=Nocardia sp. NPDC056100 TaxID=3345712 RepID=UPI0035D9EE1C